MSGPTALPPPQRSRQQRLRDLWPDLRAILYPRRWILITGLVLIGLVRIASMAPPVATKFLIDDVIGKGEAGKLPKIVGVVVAATLFQQLTNYSLTQMFSRSTLRLIGE